MNPNLNQGIARHKGEAYSLIFTVDLGDPEANAASVSAPVFAVGSVTIASGITTAEAGSGVVAVTVPVSATAFGELASGTYLFELSLRIGGDPAVVAGGLFSLLTSRTLGA